MLCPAELPHLTSPTSRPTQHTSRLVVRRPVPSRTPGPTRAARASPLASRRTARVSRASAAAHRPRSSRLAAERLGPPPTSARAASPRPPPLRAARAARVALSVPANGTPPHAPRHSATAGGGGCCPRPRAMMAPGCPVGTPRLAPVRRAPRRRRLRVVCSLRHAIADGTAAAVRWTGSAPRRVPAAPAGWMGGGARSSIATRAKLCAQAAVGPGGKAPGLWPPRLAAARRTLQVSVPPKSRARLDGDVVGTRERRPDELLDAAEARLRLEREAKSDLHSGQVGLGARAKSDLERRQVRVGRVANSDLGGPPSRTWAPPSPSWEGSRETEGGTKGDSSRTHGRSKPDLSPTWPWAQVGPVSSRLIKSGNGSGSESSSASAGGRNT